MQRQYSTPSPTASTARPVLAVVQRADSARPRRQEEEEDIPVKFRRPHHHRLAPSPQSVRIVSLMPTTTTGGVTRLVPVPAKIGSSDRLSRSTSRLRKSSDQSQDQPRSRVCSEVEPGHVRKVPSGQESGIRMSTTPSRDLESPVRASLMSLDRSLSKLDRSLSKSTDIERPTYLMVPRQKSTSKVEDPNRKSRTCCGALKAINQRFGLKHFVLALVLVGYSFLGATLFQLLERPTEEAFYKKMHNDAAIRREEVLRHLVYKFRGSDCLERREIIDLTDTSTTTTTSTTTNSYQENHSDHTDQDEAVVDKRDLHDGEMATLDSRHTRDIRNRSDSDQLALNSNFTIDQTPINSSSGSGPTSVSASEMQYSLLSRSNISVDSSAENGSIQVSDQSFINSIDTIDHISTNSIDTTDHISRNSIDITDHMSTNSIDITDHISTKIIDTSDHISTKIINTTDHMSTNSIDTTDHISTIPIDTSAQSSPSGKTSHRLSTRSITTSSGGPEKTTFEPRRRSRLTAQPNLADILSGNQTDNESEYASCYAALRAPLIAYEKELGIYEPGPKYEWDFWNSLFFALTIFTTIGYGHMACKTPWGRLVTVLYALAGIPLMLAFLNGLGDVLFRKARLGWNKARRFYRLFVRVLRAQRKEGASVKRSLSRAASSVSTNPANEPYENFPLILAIGLVLCYVMACAGLFCLWETNWDYWTAVYFFFVSLTTVGFGDILPDHPRFTILGFIFFIIGLALVSMCINVIQAKVEKQYQYYFNWDEIHDLIAASGEDGSRPVSVLITAPTPSDPSVFGSTHKLSVVPEEAEDGVTVGHQGSLGIFQLGQQQQGSLGVFQIVRYPQEPLRDSSSEEEPEYYPEDQLQKIEDYLEEHQQPSEISSTPPPEPDMKSLMSSISEGPQYPAAFFEEAKIKKPDRSMIMPASAEIEIQKIPGPHKFVSRRSDSDDSKGQKIIGPHKYLSLRGGLRRPDSLPLGADYLTIPLMRSQMDEMELKHVSDAKDRQLRVSFSPSVPSVDNE